MTILALILGITAGYSIRWLSALPGTRWDLGGIQQFCARQGKAQLDDTARVLQQLRMNPDMLKALLKMGPPAPEKE